MPEQPEKPAPAPLPTPETMHVDGGVAKAVGGTLVGALLIIFTSFPVLLALLRAGDPIGILKWSQSGEGATFIAAAGLVATLGWRVSARVRSHLKLWFAARSASDRVALTLSRPTPWVVRMFGPK